MSINPVLSRAKSRWQTLPVFGEWCKPAKCDAKSCFGCSQILEKGRPSYTQYVSQIVSGIHDRKISIRT